jgi:hypothetical protein
MNGAASRSRTALVGAYVWMETATSGTWDGKEPVRKDQPGCGWNRRLKAGGAAVVPLNPSKDGGGKGDSRSRSASECRGDLRSLNKNISQGQSERVYAMEFPS